MAFEALFGRARVIFEADTTRLRNRLKRVGFTVRETAKDASDSFRAGFGRGLARARAGIDRLNVGLTKFRGIVTSPAFLAIAGVFTAIALAIGSAVREAAAFESELAKLQPVIKAAGGDLETVSAALQSLPPELGSSTELARGFAGVLRRVGDEADALKILEEAAKLARGQTADLARSGEQVASILKVFGLEAEEAARITDGLSAAADRTGLSTEALADSILRSGRNAARIGFTFEGLLGTLVATQDVTEDLSKTNIGLEGAIRSVGTRTDAFRKIGIDLNEILGGPGGVNAFLEALAEASKGSDDELKALIGDASAANTVLALMGKNFQRTKTTIDDFTDSTGATDEQLQATLKNFNASLETLGNAISNFKVTFGSNFLGPLAEAARGLTVVIDKVNRFGSDTKKAGEEAKAADFLGTGKSVSELALELAAAAIPGKQLIDVFRNIGKVADQEAKKAKEAAKEIAEEAKEGTEEAQKEIIVGTKEFEDFRKAAILERREALQAAIIRGAEDAALKQLEFERRLLKDTEINRQKILELDKQITDERIKLADIAFERRRAAGLVGFEEEREQLLAIANDTDRSVEQRIDALKRLDEFQEEQADKRLSTLQKVLKEVQASFEEEGRTEATALEVQRRFAEISAKTFAEAEGSVTKFALGGRVNLEKFSESLERFGELKPLADAEARFGGFGAIAAEGIELLEEPLSELQKRLTESGGFKDSVEQNFAVDPAAIEPSVMEIASIYDGVFTNIETRSQEFVQNLVRSIAAGNTQIVEGASGLIEDFFARSVEFDLTRR